MVTCYDTHTINMTLHKISVMEVLFSFFLTILMVAVCESTNSTLQCPNVKSSLGAIRKRRHLTFPDGSNFVLTISLVKAFLTHAPAGWNLSLEIDVAFPLPDAKFSNFHWRRKLHHRQKRDFWERLQNAIDFHNLNGRACVLKSICEAKTHLAPPGKSLVHDILRAVFTIIVSDVKLRLLYDGDIGKDILLSITDYFRAPIHEEDFTDEIADMYSEILDPNFCEQINDCPFSLLHFVLALNKQKY